jgi:hypothetical protein
MEADFGRSVIGLAQQGAARFAQGEGRSAAGVEGAPGRPA